MVYDYTQPELAERQRQNLRHEDGATGYAIHQNWKDETDHRHQGAAADEHQYALYSDDGRGNGDYIAGSSDLYWIRRIADALDQTQAVEYDVHGNRK